MLIKDRALILSNWILLLYVFSIIVFDEGSAALKLVRIIFFACCAAKILIEKRLYFNRFLLYSFAFASFCLLSVFWAVSRENAMNQFFTLLFNCICAFCVINFISNDITRIDLIIKSVFFSSIILGIRVALQYGPLVFLASRGGIEMISANTVGMISAISVVFGVYILMNNISVCRLPYYAGIVFNIAVLMLSASRKAVLYAVIPLLFYFVFKSANPLKIIRNILFSLIFLILLYLLFTQVDILYTIVGSRIQSLLYGFFGLGKTDDSTALRLDMIKWGLSWFRAKPWLGFGINNYSVLLGKMGTSYGSAGVYAHNNYVELLVDVGITGTLLYYSVYVDILVSGIKNLFKMNSCRLMMFGLFTALVINEYGTVSYYSKFLQLILLVIWLMMKRDSSVGVSDAPLTARHANFKLSGLDLTT